MVGLGQGAQIGNFAGDGIEKHIQLGRSKRKLYVWGRAPGLGTLLWMELKRRFNLEDQKQNCRFGAERPDWEPC